MALKMRFVHRDILDPARRLIPVDLLDPVNKKEGIAMRDKPLDQVDVRRFQRLDHLWSFRTSLELFP